LSLIPLGHSLSSLAFKITIPAVKISGNCTPPSFPDDDSSQLLPCLSTVEKPDMVLSDKYDEPEDISFLDSLAMEDILPPVLEDEAELGDFLLDLF
jgi:hypothetical protein